jgi:tRNA nucleotidyltransferase/poly(A) polymerase
MAKVARIEPELRNHILDPDSAQVLVLLDSYEIPHRIVGGAVRNLIMGKAPRDIDIVADVDPSELVYVFEQAGIATDLGGIAHGTVKAVFGYGKQEQKVDVSSLGYRITQAGHRLHVSRTHNWKTDARMRDLTINAMSMDSDGIIYDYVGGYADIHNQVVRLCDQAHVSLQADATSMMRYFRALAMFPDPQIVPEDLKLIKQLLPNLAQVADDKKTQMNLITILNSAHRHRVLQFMCELGVQKYVPSVPCMVQENES